MKLEEEMEEEMAIHKNPYLDYIHIKSYHFIEFLIYLWMLF